MNLENCLKEVDPDQKLKATIAEVVQENLEMKKKFGDRLQRRGQI